MPVGMSSHTHGATLVAQGKVNNGALITWSSSVYPFVQATVLPVAPLHLLLSVLWTDGTVPLLATLPCVPQ